MAVTQGIFNNTSNFEERYIPDYQRLTGITDHIKGLGVSVVLTAGSFDLVHQGHAAYLEAAKELGGFLVVAVDSDDKLRQRKGPSRPVVPELERLRMLTHLRAVDAVTLKPVRQSRWELMKLIRPDVLVVTAETYSKDEVKQLKEYCGEVAILERMGETSTSARLRLLQLELAKKLSTRLNKDLPDLIQAAIDDELNSKPAKI